MKVKLTGSVIVPWLFFGPLMLMLAAQMLWQVTAWPWVARVAQAALIWVVAFAIVAFATCWCHRRRL